MREEKEIVRKMWERLELSQKYEEDDQPFNAEYQKGYGTALFWALDKELHEINEVLKEMGLTEVSR